MGYNFVMANWVGTIAVALELSPAVELSPSDRRTRWLELGLVMLVAFAVPILNGLYLLVNGPGATHGISSLRWKTGLVQEIGALAVLKYVLSRRSLGFASLGFRWSVGGVGTGLLLAIASYAAYLTAAMLAHVAHFWIYGNVVAGVSARDVFGHPPLAVIPFYILQPVF